MLIFYGNGISYIIDALPVLLNVYDIKDLCLSWTPTVWYFSRESNFKDGAFWPKGLNPKA